MCIRRYVLAMFTSFLLLLPASLMLGPVPCLTPKPINQRLLSLNGDLYQFLGSHGRTLVPIGKRDRRCKDLGSLSSGFALEVSSTAAPVMKLLSLDTLV